MLTSKVTTKGQVTLPKELRQQLGVEPGDTIVYIRDSNGFRISKLRGFDKEWHQALAGTLEQEWNSLEDQEAFRDL